MMLLSRHVRQMGYKCVLSGEGADELFAGYPVFVKGKSSIEDKYDSAVQTLDLLADNSVKVSAMNTFAKFIRRHTNGKALLAENQEKEIHTKLSGYLLASQGDRVAMSHGVEQRFPFLDEELVDFVTRLPEAQKLNGSTGKVLLKTVFADMLPQEILERPKQGYLAPDLAVFSSQKFLGDYHKTFLSDAAVKKSGYFDVKRVNQLKELVERTGVRVEPRSQRSWLFILTTQMLYHLFIAKGI